MDTWQDKTPSVKGNRNLFVINGHSPWVIMLVKGENTSGLPRWAYAQIFLKNYGAFKAAEQRGNYDLKEFAEILKSGDGKEPPEEVRRDMQEQYGCDENFEASLIRLVEQARDAWNAEEKEG
jgi:hypothetical protein